MLIIKRILIFVTLLLILSFSCFTLVTAQQQQKQQNQQLRQQNQNQKKTQEIESFWDQVIEDDEQEEEEEEGEGGSTQQEELIEEEQEDFFQQRKESNEIENEFFDSEIDDDATPTQQQETNTNQNQYISATRVFQWPQKDDWTLEICFLVVILIFGINYFYGRNLNQKIVREWVNYHSRAFRRHFNNFSLYPSENNNSRMIITKESPFEFSLYGHGNPYCTGFIASLKLKRRQDLFSYPLNFFRPASDELLMYVPMKKLDTFVYAIAKESETSEFKDKHYDLKTYGNISKHKAQNITNAGFSCITDVPELNENELIQTLFNAIASAPNLFISLHISDCSPYAENMSNKRLLRVHMKLPSKENQTASLEMLETFLQLIGFIANYQLPSFVRRRISIRRNAVEEKLRKEERERQKELKEQKSYEIKKNRDKQLKSSSREQQAKAEKKKRKKEEKKAMGKSKIIR